MKIEEINIEEEKKELEKLQELQMFRLNNQPHRYYTPIGKIEEFYNLIGSGKYLVTLLSAANSIGKTFGAANLLANMFWPVDNAFFDQPVFKKWPYPKAGRIVSDPTTITDTIIPTLKKVFPKGRYSEKVETSKDGKHYEYHWKTDTGWEFNIMSNDQDVKEFESATLGWFWFDEPPRESIYKATIARLRLGGVGWITATPLTGSAWMYDEIITNPNNEAGFRAFVQANVEDACIEHGVRGFLKHEDIVRQISQYNEEDKQARVFGKFQHLTGLVFKTFSRKIHVIKPFNVTPATYSVIELLDPHPRNPDSVMWVATDRYGRKFVVDELYTPVESTNELAYLIKNKAANYRVIERRADPAAWNTDQHRKSGLNATKSLAAELDELGLEYSPASKSRTMGITLIRNQLHYELDHQVNDGITRFIKPPNLYIFDTCVRTIFEFEHWQFNEWTGKSAEKKDKSEKPQDKDDHEMENLGRALLDDPGWVPYTTPRSYSPLSEDINRNVVQPKLDPY